MELPTDTNYIFYLILVALVCSGLLFLYFNPFVINLAKTFYLITKVSPYEKILAEAPSILVLGDSTGYGTGANKKEESIAGLIGKDFPEYSIKNNSKNGRTIGELVEVTEKIDTRYELILLQIGGNDILQERDLAIVEKELRTIITNLSEHTDKIVMMSTGNVGGASAFSSEKSAKYESITRDFRAMFLKASEETNMSYIDLFLEREDDLFVQQPDKYLAWDGLHPSSAGYALWYESLAPVLRASL